MVWQVISTFEKGIFKQELKVCIPPFVSDTNDNKNASETGRFNSASLNPNGTNSNTAIPSGFDTIATTAANVNTLPVTLADNSFTGSGLKVDASSLGPWRTTIAPEKPESAFGVANDDQTYSINSTNANDIGMREA
jgi:hypothetical protein